MQRQFDEATAQYSQTPATEGFSPVVDLPMTREAPSTNDVERSLEATNVVENGLPVPSVVPPYGDDVMDMATKQVSFDAPEETAGVGAGNSAVKDFESETFFEESVPAADAEEPTVSNDEQGQTRMR